MSMIFYIEKLTLNKYNNFQKIYMILQSVGKQIYEICWIVFRLVDWKIKIWRKIR